MSRPFAAGAAMAGIGRAERTLNGKADGAAEAGTLDHRHIPVRDGAVGPKVEGRFAIEGNPLAGAGPHLAQLVRQRASGVNGLLDRRIARRVLRA